MSAKEIDAYLAKLEEPKRGTLQKVRETILSIVPDAEQGISYGMPAFRKHGKVFAGFAAFKHHLAYVPHSGSVLPALAGDLEDYTYTEGSLHFRVDEPLPRSIVKKLIDLRLKHIDQG